MPGGTRDGSERCAAYTRMRTPSMRWAVLAMVVTVGCSLYFEDAGDPRPTSNDSDPAWRDANAPSCSMGCDSTTGCGPGRHCEVQCAPPGTDDCILPCQHTCVPDTPCTAIDCGPDKTCVQNCSRECGGMAELCFQSCTSNDQPAPCERMTDEASCAARTDCIVIRRCVSCSCGVGVGCACHDPNGPFARCEPARANASQ